MDVESIQRIAANETSFRELNEMLRRSRRVAGTDELFPCRCECGVLGCNQLLELTVSEYEQVRSSGTQFAVVDGHQTDAVEHVVRREKRFTVVEKHGEAADIARDADPRAAP